MSRGIAAAAIAVLDIVGYVVLVTATPVMSSDPASRLMFGGAVVAFSVMGALLVRGSRRTASARCSSLPRPR